ncbi:MAG: 5-formyltetrahydrofolate cyclo-ligase [Candidatus Latescibacteria bacterium]|jgi:5-formyltetrahydrofolate cyclo-ligase|nr:5-formyltetrahydrofolate cyclo-ligase [Candidatus Latescibacterota bacterium]MBT4138340.1 5-formyltetrahydrofolate cyclo-ligase [Candidatus Latescibacterota bacterium]
MDKDELRQVMGQKRDQAPAHYIYKVQEAICERMVVWSVFQAAQLVASYVSVRKEVDTHRLIEHALKVGKRVCVPVTEGKGVMVFQELLSLDELKPARFGLMEPEYDADRIVAPACLDLMMVPGVAFDRQGNRLGFGGGYYDRYLTHCDATYVGLAYGFQVVDDIPTEGHDVRLDWLVTEHEVISCTQNL